MSEPQPRWLETADDPIDWEHSVAFLKWAVVLAGASRTVRRFHLSEPLSAGGSAGGSTR